MHKIKYLMFFIFFVIIALPAKAIEDTYMPQQQSTNLTGIEDYTGDAFFKSFYELQEERREENEQRSKDFYHSFVPQYAGEFDYYAQRKSRAPLRIFRDSVSEKLNSIKEKRASAKEQREKDKNITVDANGVVETENVSQEENEVLAEENEPMQTLIKCKLTKYLPETGEIEGVGDVYIYFPEDNVKMYSDRMTYNTSTGIMQLYGDVKIDSDGNIICGEYMKIDMNDESGFLKHPIMEDYYSLNLVAENGYMFGDTFVAENGKITSDYDDIFNMRSSGFGEALRRLVVPREELHFVINDINQSKYLIKVDEINIKAKNAHDTIKLKHPKIYSNKTGKKLVSLPSMTFYTNKERDYFEGNYPELGSFSEFGMYAGPGIVLEAPFGSTLKIVPTVNYKNKFGFGFVSRFKSGSNQTELGYNTASQNIILKGLQRIDDHLFFQYGANTYMNNWFLGQSWIGYGGEFLYERGYNHQDFLYEGADLSFRHRISAGIFRENSKNIHNKNLRGYHKMSTPRLRYMAQIDQTLISLFRGEDRTYYDGWRKANLRLEAQGAVSLYGTGDTQVVGRIGPSITTQYKLWSQDLGFFLSAAEDNTPMVSMDSFRFGRSNIYIREYIRLNNYLTFGLYSSYNLAGSVYDYQTGKDKLREATFYVALGPDDFKLNLGYDFLRQNSYFGISMAMNPKNSQIDYKKMQIKNPDMLGKVKGLENDVGIDSLFTPPPSPYIDRAVVSDVQDKTEYIQGEPL